jgi:arginyl-tRNA synthetase
MVQDKNAERVAQGKPPLPEEDHPRVAHAVATAAIKYADLSSDRVKDYVFSWSRMLAAEGNTGPYLQYAHARIRSILTKAETAGIAHGPVLIEAPQERALALMLLSFEGAVREVGATLEPHKLCTYLYELSSAFSSFYVNCPVLKSGPTEAQRASRLTLVLLTANVIAQGLALLGIEAPERM